MHAKNKIFEISVEQQEYPPKSYLVNAID